MTKRKLVIALVVSLAAIGFWVMRVKSFRYSSLKTPSAPSAQVASGSSSKELPALETSKDKLEKMQEIWTAENSKPLDFFGKVIDQNGNPVEGVKVKASVGLILGFERSGGRDYHTETDVNGRFSYVGIQGAGVGFTLTKEGYFYSKRLPSANRPSNYIPDPDRPTVFPIWKLTGSEPMVHVETHVGLECDGTVVEFDLFTGKQAPGGDLRVSFVRSPTNIDRSKPFDWTLTLQTTDGGLVAIADDYPNEAPAAGYQSSVIVRARPSQKEWASSFSKSYYFRIRGGRAYGRLTVNLTANYQPPPTYFQFESYANPSGSRNLEYDPTKTVKSFGPPVR